VRKLLCSLAAVTATFGPIPVSAAPSPSPALGAVLLAAPAGYTQLATGPFHGQFTLREYARQFQSSNLETTVTLVHDGFVDGYGMEWVQRSTGRLLLEFVIAFKGGSGAKDWLGYEEKADKADPAYQHTDTMSGIDPYFGIHLILTSPRIYSDAFAFVKGNDLFYVSFASSKDDALKLTTAQTRRQYDSAPVETIPKAQWPENAPSQRPQTNFLGAIIGVILVLVIIGGVVRLVMIRRRG